MISVRRPKSPNFFNRESYYYKWLKWQQSLPNEGDRIKITWLPDNCGVKNAYIGWEGVVESLNKKQGAFALNSGDAILICHGNFDYITL